MVIALSRRHQPLHRKPAYPFRECMGTMPVYQVATNRSENIQAPTPAARAEFTAIRWASSRVDAGKSGASVGHPGAGMPIVVVQKT
jgi:hypothetical protein